MGGFSDDEKDEEIREAVFDAGGSGLCIGGVVGRCGGYGIFGLREALLPEKGSVYATDGNGIVIPGEYEQKDFVSLSGYQDTPESKALAEWQAFLEDYDKDGSIISAIGNDPTGFEDRYGLYLVYTQEMADRLEEIVEKYHLRLHSRIEDVFPETWPVAVGDFFEEHVTPYSGYIYEDGTFRFDGDAVFEDYGRIDYQFSRSVRGLSTTWR